jgi:hypothetical protein
MITLYVFTPPAITHPVSGIEDEDVLINIPPPIGLNGIVGLDPVTSHLVNVEFHTMLYCPSTVVHVVRPFLIPLQLNCKGPYAVEVPIAIKHN